MMTLIDRVATNLFSWMRTFALLCLVVAVVAGSIGGWAMAAPALRAAALMALAGWAPAMVQAAFVAKRRATTLKEGE